MSQQSEVEHREKLLMLAEGLARKLSKAQVPRYRGGSREIAPIGIPASCMSQLVNYLRNHRNMKGFQAFLARIHELDSRNPQNIKNPKANYRILRNRVESFLRKTTGLPVEDYFFIFGWVQRLLPKEGRDPADVHKHERPSAMKQSVEAEQGPSTVPLLVKKDPGSGALSAQMADGSAVFTGREDAARFLARLPDGINERFKSKSAKKKGGILFNVTVEKLGLGWKIVKLELPGSS